MNIIGVDPGGHWTGIVAVHNAHLLRAVTVSRDAELELPDAGYLHEVNDVIAELAAGFSAPPDAVVVEGVKDPSAHMGLTNVKGLIGTAMVLGAVLLRWPAAIVVPPGGHGSGNLRGYPRALQPTRGVGAGRDKLRHVRSAYDVALAGRILAGRR